MAKVSIIIPVYGVEKYLRECLDSVLAQTLEDLEIILLDDGGKDSCPQMIDEYAAKDSRIVAIHKENGGYGHTCNMGLERATGEYVAIVEPDDFIDKNMYKELYNKAVENDADIVKSGYYENYDLGEDSFKKLKPELKGFAVPNKVFTLKEYPQFVRMHPSIWSCIYKREFLEKNQIRFVEAPGAGWTDNPFQVQTMCLADRIVYVDKPYYYWRKCNLDDANDLKDISIPFKRIKEIRQWMNDNNINDDGILSYLYKREIVYLHIMNRIVNKNNIKNFKDYVKEYVLGLDYELVKRSNIIKKREKRFLMNLKKWQDYTIFQDKFKVFKANIFKFRYNKNEKFLYLFGRCIWRKG